MRAFLGLAVVLWMEQLKVQPKVMRFHVNGEVDVGD
jgi:hypothetical protein